MIITPPPLAEVTGHAADMYASDMSDDGFVHTYTQAMAINPEAHQAFEALIRAIVPSIGIGNYEAAILGAARAIGSTHCLLAHGRKSVKAGVVDTAGLHSFAHDHDSSFTDAERAIIRFAGKLSTEPRKMSDADAAELREQGFSDRQIVDITLAASARNFFSRALLALMVPPDDMSGLDADVAEALRERSRNSRGAWLCAEARRKMCVESVHLSLAA